MSLPLNTQYIEGETLTLVHAFFWWDRTASLWRYHHRKDLIVWVESVADGEGPRRWFMSWGSTYNGTQRESPAFGNLDSLLVWAKLEGLL